MFHARVSDRPDATAVGFGGEKLSSRDLDVHVNQLARLGTQEVLRLAARGRVLGAAPELILPDGPAVGLVPVDHVARAMVALARRPQSVGQAAPPDRSARCGGNAARLEAAVLFEELFTRGPRLEPAGEPERGWRVFANHLMKLPVSVG
jgi:hypothetical protein